MDQSSVPGRRQLARDRPPGPRLRLRCPNGFFQTEKLHIELGSREGPAEPGRSGVRPHLLPERAGTEAGHRRSGDRRARAPHR
jgi:hypothetical protein